MFDTFNPDTMTPLRAKFPSPVRKKFFSSWMEYRKIGDNYYIRMDRGDEIISKLLAVCEKESIPSAILSSA